MIEGNPRILTLPYSSDNDCMVLSLHRCRQHRQEEQRKDEDIDVKSPAHIPRKGKFVQYQNGDHPECEQRRSNDHFRTSRDTITIIIVYGFIIRLFPSKLVYIS